MHLLSGLSKLKYISLIFGFIAVGLFLSSSPQSAFQKNLRPITPRFFQRVCGSPLQGFARCNAQVVVNTNGRPQVGPTIPAGSYGPAQFHTGYSLPCTPGGTTQSTCPQPSSFGPQVIGIVDAYNDPTVESDLAVYDSAFGLPSCTKANGCLTVVNENGGTSLPSSNSNWALEISLDIQVAHATCQTCKILLVEANSSSITDLGTSVNTAASLGATAISNSYGASEWSTETANEGYYTHPGIAVTASAGDSGYGTEFPAASPNVVAVGGTTLQLFSDNTYAGESVWNGTGSGCSSYENAKSWQTGLSNWGQTGCGTHRAITDVSADADPNTGAAVYDSTPYQGLSGWWIVGGTSLSSPLIASTYALTGGVPSNTNAGQLLYQNYSLSNFHDVTTGSNGNCLTIMCKGTVGYDGPTGLGSPNGLLGFMLSGGGTPTPTATPTPSLSPTPTITPTPTPIDTTPPVVTITNPADNSFVARFSRVTISATATDDVAVAKVEFYINGVLVTTDTVSPYQYAWHVPSTKNKAYTIIAKAYDPSGNVGSDTISVTAK